MILVDFWSTITFSTLTACHLCVKCYNSSPSADHFDVWHHWSAMSSSPLFVWKNISATPTSHVTVTIPSSEAVKTHDNTTSPHSQHDQGWVGAEGHGEKGCTGCQGPSHSWGARSHEGGKIYPGGVPRSHIANAWPPTHWLNPYINNSLPFTWTNIYVDPCIHIQCIWAKNKENLHDFCGCQAEAD